MWLGRYLSEPKPGFRAERGGALQRGRVARYLRGGGVLGAIPGSRFHYIAEPEGEVLLFVDGQEFALGPAVAFMAPAAVSLSQPDAGPAARGAQAGPFDLARTARRFG